MEEAGINVDNIKDYAINFAKVYAEHNAPNSDKDYLLVALKKFPKNIDKDEASLKISGLFNKEGSRYYLNEKFRERLEYMTYCRYFIFSEGKYQQLSDQEIENINPQEVSKGILIERINDAGDYFRMDTEFFTKSPHGTLGQGWQVDLQTNDNMLVTIPKSKHMTWMT